MEEQAPQPAKPLPKDLAVLRELYDHSVKCFDYAERVRHRNRRSVEKLLAFANGQTTYAELEVCQDAIKANQDREANDFTPKPERLWAYCDRALVDQMQDLGASGQRCLQPLPKDLMNEAEADAWANSVVCLGFFYRHRLHLLSDLRDRLAKELDLLAQDSPEAARAITDVPSKAVEHLGGLPASPVESGKAQWSEPDSPKRWAIHFGLSWDTLKRRFAEGAIRHKKLSTKSYQIHVEDLPTKH